MNRNIITAAAFIILVCMAVNCSKKPVITEGTGDDVRQDGNKNQAGTIIKGNSIIDSGIKDVENHSGTYNVKMGAYNGELYIGTADGMFYATIRFLNWGNGVPQPLKDLSVNEGKIYFVRSIDTKDDLAKYGGTSFFKQEFYGIFSKNGKIIRGYYRYLGAQDNWEAAKK